MAVALLGKCVALLGLVVLLYATCYGFRIRDVAPQTHPAVCTPAHGKACPAEKTVTTTAGPTYLARKWQELRTVAGGRKPPAEPSGVESTVEHPRDKSATGSTPRESRIKSIEVNDDDDDDDEVEDEQEDGKSVNSERDQTDKTEDDDEEKEEDSKVEDKKKKLKKKHARDDDDDDEHDGDDDNDNEDKDEDEDEDEDKDEDDDDDDDNDDKSKDKDDNTDEEEDNDNVDKKILKKDSKKKIKETKTEIKTAKMVKYTKTKADDGDDDDNEKDDKKEEEEENRNKEQEEKITKRDKKKVTESLKKQISAPYKKQDKEKIQILQNDNDEDDEKQEEKITTKRDKKKVTESLKKQTSAPHKKQDKEKIQSDNDKDEDNKDDKDKDDEDDKNDKDDEDDDDDEDNEDDEDDEDDEDVEETTPAPRKLEKVRFADKDKAKTLSSKGDEEKLKQEDKKSIDVAKPAVESVKKMTEKPKKSEPIESIKKPVESTKKVEAVRKSDESAKKLSESAKKVEPAAPKPKVEPPKIATKVDEKSKARTKPETPPPAPKSKERAKEADVKKVTAKPTSKPSKEVPQAEKRETKPQTRKPTDASITLSELNDAILHVPTFVPNFTNVENPECQQHGKIFLRQLRGYKLWALQMLDSSAKIPSSLLRGNVNQLGDYDQCLGVLAHVKIDEKTIKIQGKYCLATVDLYASHPDMKLPVNLMQARAFVRGNMNDPGHFIPKFTTINWALCLPAACSADDAERALESALEEYNGTVGIKFTANVDSNMCYVKQKSQAFSKETIGVLYFYAMIVCLVIVATVRDYLVETQGKGNYSERIIMSFSLRRTVKALLKEATSSEDITCIHGIRALATIALYVAHQVIIISWIPLSNRISLTEIANSPASSVMRVSLVYTDAFLLLSGVLTAYNMAKELTNRGEIRWFCRFIARFIRLSPALLAVVFWYAFVMEHVGSGPQWNSIITANAELCKYNAWTNLLYVQNFFPFEEMCATHTHQLALDMQLSFLAPILVFFLQFKSLIGILLIVFLILLSATLRYIATINNYLSLVIFHGISLKRLYRTANLTYALPLHRATPYVFGVGLGVLLHYTGKNVRIHKVLVILGWLIASALGSWSLFSPWHQARRDYVYDVEEAAHYAVIGPVMWAVALCWLIFACFTEHGGVINRFLSNYWLIIFSRISYAVYLTQFAVFFYNVGTTRFSAEFQLHRSIDPLELAIVIAASIVLTLLFDLPMQEVKSVIMESTDTPAVEAVEEKKTSEDKSVAESAKTIEHANVFEDDEVASTGWDWQKDIAHGATILERQDTEEEIIDVPILKKANGRRMSFIDRETYDTEDASSRDRVRAAVRRPSRDNTENDTTERGRKVQRYATDDSEEEAIELLRSQREREAATPRNRRSLSRSKDSKRLSSRESESEEEWQRKRESDDDTRQFRRSESRGRTSAREADDYRSWEFVGKEGPPGRQPQEATSRQTKPPLARPVDVARRTFSSESEEDSSARGRSQPERVPSSDARTTSDEEEGWERELRIRRKQFMEKLVAPQLAEDEEGETGAEPLKRRSSAEGRIALLSDDLSAEDNMDSWTVSVGPRFALLGSSQEPSEPEDDAIYMRRREYREQGPPSREESQSEEESSQETSKRQLSYTSGSQKTSLEEEEDVNFTLTKDSKKESLQDLSKLSQEELASAGWNVVRKEDEPPARPTSTGLFKRESIVKSQASEEDPEYLLPERPKLVQQEREHPFKKAWQKQKSRSEEEGSSAYAIKDPKEPQSEAKAKEQGALAIKRERSGEQSDDVDSFADEEAEVGVMLRGGSTDAEDNRTSSKSGTDETDSVSTEYSRDTREGDHRQSSKSETDEDSARFNWPGDEEEEEEDEIYKTGRRSKSEEADWEQEET